MLVVLQKDIIDVYHGMVIEDTPSLVVDQEGPTRINVISAPKLTVVGYSFDKYSKLVIGSTSVQIRLGPVVDNVIQHNNHIECLDLHLSEITLNSYRGTLQEIIFARFFVVRARVLKVMRFALHLFRKKNGLSISVGGCGRME